jgi:hypothetical protein
MEGQQLFQGFQCHDVAWLKHDSLVKLPVFVQEVPKFWASLRHLGKFTRPTDWQLWLLWINPWVFVIKTGFPEHSTWWIWWMLPTVVCWSYAATTNELLIRTLRFWSLCCIESPIVPLKPSVRGFSSHVWLGKCVASLQWSVGCTT